MPICPNCGAHLEDGAKTCSCGTAIESDYDKLMRNESEKVEIFNEYKDKSLAFFEKGEYEKSLEYADKLKEMDMGFDAAVLFSCGQSNFYLKRYYDALVCFLEYIEEYENSFYRFADISGAYEWKGECLWQLGFGFESIKSYYNALDNVNKHHCSIDEKMEMRTRIEEARLKVINASMEVGIQNPRLGTIDTDVFDWFQNQQNPTRNMQNLYDALDAMESDGYMYEALKIKNGNIYVVFENGMEKRFDGSAALKD